MSTTLVGLLERVRAATGPDREIDCYLTILLMQDGHTGSYPDAAAWVKAALDDLWNIKRYTASVDDALALVERCLPGCAIRIQRNLDGSKWAELQRKPGPGNFDVYNEGGAQANLPLAILAALLCALIAKETKP